MVFNRLHSILAILLSVFKSKSKGGKERKKKADLSRAQVLLQG